MRLSEQFAQAEREFAQGEYDEALRSFAAIVAAAPAFTRARDRVADALLNVGERARAKEVYKALAWHHIKSGQPLLGLVSTKMLLALEPGYDDLLEIICGLYSSESDRVSVDLELQPPPEPPEIPAPAPFSLGISELYDVATRLAADTEAITKAPPALPPIPLFSHLPEAAFSQVLRSLRLRRLAVGEKIVREGDQGDSFFMLADGNVVVSKIVNGKDHVLARLGPGAVFGEMALVARSPRSATVTADSEVAVLMLARRDLEVHAGQHEEVTKALRKFTRGRFLANLAATSPLFAPLERHQRRELMRKFQSKIVYPGDIIIEEGEPGRGLFLVLRGEYEVTQKGLSEPLAKLDSGDVFGEIALLRDTPTSATVTALAQGELLFLGKDEFAAALDALPEVLRTLKALSTERLRTNRLAEQELPFTDDATLLL